MAPNRWVNDINNAADRFSDEMQGYRGYNFDVVPLKTVYSVSVVDHSETLVLAPWAIAAIALGALFMLVCLVWLVVACCRCCCRSESGRVLVAPQPLAPEPQVVTQYMPAHYPVSPTPLMMQQAGAAASHGAGMYSGNNKSSRSQPPAYDQEVLVQLNDTQKYPLLN